MKTFALCLGALLIFGPATVAVAQSSQAGSGTGTTSERAADPGAGAATARDSGVKGGADPSGPAAAQPSDRKPDVNVNVEKRDGSEARRDRDDGGAALPRAAAEDRTRIFGMTPAAAVVIGVALLVVVILAIVAMTRSGEPTFIDRDRDM
jgi:cobalamin biosynthesis Mg chelatase CobN